MAAAALTTSLVLLMAVVTLSDLRTRLVPDGPLLGALAIGIAVSAVAFPAELPGRLAAGAGAGAFLLAAALARPAGMGLGDVKLAGVIGVYLGAAVVQAMLIAFATGSAAGLVLVARRGWRARHDTIPFAPCLAIGALTALALGPDAAIAGPWPDAAFI
jgi:leader peptidase (prepilin peptidase) / N-methyltransferase